MLGSGLEGGLDCLFGDDLRSSLEQESKLQTELGELKGQVDLILKMNYLIR